MVLSPLVLQLIQSLLMTDDTKGTTDRAELGSPLFPEHNGVYLRLVFLALCHTDSKLFMYSHTPEELLL